MNARLVGRHTLVGLMALAIGAVFWFTRLDWDPEMRFWRAVGDASLLLLIVALTLGPLARLWPATAKLLPWRREVGIWFGVLALVHTLLILNGWVRWDVGSFFGYEFIPQLGRVARIEPGFGLANLTGLVATAWALLLTATSSDWAIKKLGPSAWKWLHYGSYSIFYLVALHTFYFLFQHYTLSFHRDVPPSNWFRFPFLALVVAVPLLQAAAFIKTVRQKRAVIEPVAVAVPGRKGVRPERKV